MHLDREVLYDFLLGKLASHENREVVRHLLTGCEICRRVSRDVWDGAAVPEQIDLSALASEVWHQGRSYDKEKEAAPGLVAKLEELTPERQLLLARNNSRFWTRAVCELLIDRAFDSCETELDNALRQATLATVLSDSLADEQYGRGVANDVRARAWSLLGHVQRAASRLYEAEDSFARAEAALDGGSGDPCILGRVWYRKALLRHAQRRFEEALTLHRHAAREFAAGQDAHLIGCSLVERARTLRELGDLQGAVQSIRAGMAKLDLERRPRMELVAKHNLTLYLQELGETEEAMHLVGELLPLHAQVGGKVDKLRLRWLEGKLAHLQGDLERGRDAFREVREGFVARSMPYDVALVSLDLAAVYLKLERYADVLRLAGEMVAIFRSLQIDRETIAALFFLEQAAATRGVSLALLAELASYLKRARHEPGLVFEPSPT